MHFLREVVEKFLRGYMFSPDFRLLCDNLTSLSLLQLVDGILPLVILPYLVRTLGPENYEPA